METEINISLVALIIALLALLAASAQLMQAVFGTAEGYRRCQASVMGPWANFTHRSWLWGEFRFQTKFTTPTIKIDYERSPDRQLRAQSSPQDSWNLTREENMTWNEESRTWESTFKEREKSWLPLELPEHCSLSPIWKVGLLSLFGLEQDISQFPFELAITIDPKEIRKRRLNRRQGASDNGVVQKLRTCVSRITSRADSAPGLVTWSPLLKFIYERERRLRLNDDGDNRQPGKDLLLTMVCLEERSWDLVPSDVITPYAQTTMGDLIILVNRLEMSWKEFKPWDGYLRAEGGGHSITSTTNVRGLGILVEYKRTNKTRFTGNVKSPLNHTIPCEAADMMHCGIIPPSQELDIGRAIPLVGASDDNIEDHRQSVLDLLGIRESKMKSHIQNLLQEDSRFEYTAYHTIIHAAVALFTDYLPIEGSYAHRVVWPIQTDSVRCMFRNWEGRVVFKHRLEQDAKEFQSSVLKDIVQRMQDFETTFMHDFYNRWTRSTQNLHHGHNRHLGKYFRTQYDFAMTELYKLGFIGYVGPSHMETWRIQNGERRMMRYHWLAIQHLEAIPECLKIAKGLQQRQDLRPNLWITSRGRSTDDLALELTHQYIDHYYASLDLLGTNGQIKNDLSKKVDVEAWWLMIYRAICWFAPIDVDTSCRPIIPSKYYGSEMPVYIA